MPSCACWLHSPGGRDSFEWLWGRKRTTSGDSAPTPPLLPCVAGSASRDASILATNEAIQLWKPVAVVMPGIAFGADEDSQAIADALIATQEVWEQELRSWVEWFEAQRQIYGMWLGR